MCRLRLVPARRLAVALLLILPFAVSLFFYGINLQVFGMAMVLLAGATLYVLWAGLRVGLAIPRNALTAWLAAYWAWLAVSLLWNPLLYVGTIVFWWLSVLFLAYWLYTFLPERDRIWPWLCRAALAIGLALVGVSIHQHFVGHGTPQSVFLDVNLHAALLNLIAIPATGYYFVACVRRDLRNATGIAWLVALFLLFYGILLTTGRGAVFSFLAAISLLLWYAYRRVPGRAVVTVGLLILGAFVLANLSRDGWLVERLAASFADPYRASLDRLLIWQQSWQLLLQSPFWGAGLGIYSLLWPQYRHPGDLSAGFFVHNDYLEIWIEAGLPGLLLFVGVLVAAARLALRAMRNPVLPQATRLEIAGLAGSLGAISVHAFVQFNFYVVPILLLFGAQLARLQHLASRPGHAVSWRFQPSKYFSPGGYRIITFVLLLLPTLYMASVSLSTWQLDRGVALSAEGRIEEADAALSLAHRLWPDADAPLIARADLYRQALGRASSVPERRELFESTRHLLVRAQINNPYRAPIHLLRAELYWQGREFVGDSWAEQAEHAYQEALRLNPRFHLARHGYARLALAQGDEAKARRIAEEGMSYAYSVNEFTLPYYLLTMSLRARAGDREQAEEIRRLIQAYVQSRRAAP